MLLSDVRYQGTALRRIQQALSRDRVPHAYLFHGPEGVGKETLAMGLAHLLLCGQPCEKELTGKDTAEVGLQRLREGCGRCEDCKLVAARTHPDLHLIYRQLLRTHDDPEVRKKTGRELVIDVMRDFVIRKAGLTPFRGRAKVFVIRGADSMNAASQNAMLKTLEEPQGKTFLILLVDAVDRMLPTTLSRCQVVRFHGLPESFIRDRLSASRPDLSREKIVWYSRYAAGSLGRALECAEDELFEVYQSLLKGLERLDTSADTLAKVWLEEAAALGVRHRKREPEITETEATRRGLTALLQLTAQWYADALNKGAKAGQFADAERAAAAIQRLTEAERQLGLNANTQLIVETLVADLADVAAI